VDLEKKNPWEFAKRQIYRENKLNPYYILYTSHQGGVMLV
jgi:hypothetical protein